MPWRSRNERASGLSLQRGPLSAVGLEQICSIDPKSEFFPVLPFCQVLFHAFCPFYLFPWAGCFEVFLSCFFAILTFQVVLTSHLSQCFTEITRQRAFTKRLHCAQLWKLPSQAIHGMFLLATSDAREEVEAARLGEMNAVGIFLI